MMLAHATLVGHRDVQSAVEAILGFHHLITTLHWCAIVPLMILEAWQNAPQKSRPFNINTWYTGDG